MAVPTEEQQRGHRIGQVQLGGTYVRQRPPGSDYRRHADGNLVVEPYNIQMFGAQDIFDETLGPDQYNVIDSGVAGKEWNVGGFHEGHIEGSKNMIYPELLNAFPSDWDSRYTPDAYADWYKLEYNNVPEIGAGPATWVSGRCRCACSRYLTDTLKGKILYGFFYTEGTPGNIYNNGSGRAMRAFFQHDSPTRGTSYGWMTGVGGINCVRFEPRYPYSWRRWTRFIFDTPILITEDYMFMSTYIDGCEPGSVAIQPVRYYGQSSHGGESYVDAEYWIFKDPLAMLWLDADVVPGPPLEEDD